MTQAAAGIKVYKPVSHRHVVPFSYLKGKVPPRLRDDTAAAWAW